MKASQLLIVAFIAFAMVFTFTWAVPSKLLGPHVHYVDDTNVGYYIDNPRLVSFLYIYSHRYVCIKCPAAADLVSRLAREYNGQAYVLAMDAADVYNAKTMERLQINPAVESFPILIEFPHENNPLGTRIPIIGADFAFLKKRATDLIQLLSQVRQLDGANMKQLLSFKKSNKPKAVLLTSKAQIPVMWASLSSQLSHKYDFFMGLKTDRKVVKRFDVDEFPTILVLRRNEYNMDVPEDKIEPVIFTGQQKAPIIKSFLSLYTSIENDAVSGADAFTTYKNLISNTAQFLPVYSDKQCFSAFCSPENVNSAGLCLLFVTPTIFSPSDMTFNQLQEIQYQIEVIRGLRDLRADSFIDWGLVVGQKLENDQEIAPGSAFTGTYPSFFSSFNIQAQDYPQIIIYNPKKNAYNTFLGAFSPDNISTWISEVISTGLSPLSAGINASTIQSSFPDVEPSNCKVILDKRAQYEADLKAAEEAKKKKQKSGSTAQQNIPFEIPDGVGDLDVWSKPYRPITKKGELREMTDLLWRNVHLRRNVSIMLQFLNREDGLDAKAEHDINTFRDVVESLNGMVEGYFVTCDDDSKHIRQVFGVEECDGVIIGVKARAISTEKYEDIDQVEQVLGGSQVIFETVGAEVRGPRQTFEKETLSKWATSKLFETVVVHNLSDDSDALQKWLLRSISEPKVLIFTKKSDIVLAKALALEFFGFAQVGLASPTQDSLVNQFQVDSFPAVRILIPRVQPHAGATRGEMEMKLELIAIPKQHLYYNAIASHLDQVVTTRYIGDRLQNGAVYEPIRREHPVESMMREHNEKKESEHRQKYDNVKDEL